MKKLLVLSVVILSLGIVSCDEESQEQIAAVKTVSQRIDDLNKSMNQIKELEDDAALMRDESYLLEYEYPIRESESYVVTYRFNADKCFMIQLDTYLSKEEYAKKIQKEVMTNMANNKDFKKTTQQGDLFEWPSSEGNIDVSLNIQNIERGTISLVIENR